MSFPNLRDVNRDRVDEQSRARGHAAGYAEGLRAAAQAVDARMARLDAEHAAVVLRGQAEIDRAIVLLGAAAAALDERTVPVLREAEATLVATALELAEAILGHELSDAGNSSRFALGRALDHAADDTPHTVRMNPEDLDVIDRATRERAGVRFTADPSLVRGDAITEFADGFLDARISTALERAKAALQGETA
ncbi:MULTISPECIES: FliH/SctL family protein [Cryobacterium]|uniref:FliH/SctL family protein n=1 Tax=Cryobacterium TaxID=69578 RepID=UPI0013572541|nr:MULTISPECIES: FliH/SctL family protein [Cryobacterium]